MEVVDYVFVQGGDQFSELLLLSKKKPYDSQVKLFLPSHLKKRKELSPRDGQSPDEEGSIWRS